MADDDAEAPADGSIPEEEAQERAGLQRKRQRARRADEEAAEFWRGVFADPIGRREMWALLQNCHTFEERFACGPNGFPQDLATWYQSGERDVGMRLWRSWLRLAPEGVALMMRESDPVFRDAPAARRRCRIVETE
jgi:hypothetical protein